MEFFVRRQSGASNLPTGATIAAAGSLASAGLGVFGSLTASQQQAGALSSALAAEQGMFNTAQGALKPYYANGSQLNSILTSLLTPGPNQTAALSQLPGFQFAQNWGQQAVQNLGTTTGLGGNVLTAGANFATGLAQQNFAQNLVNPLLQQYQIGAQAAGALGSAAGTFSGQIGQTTGAIGQAQAAGTLGATNALSSGVNGATNGITNSLLLSRLFGSLTPGGGTYGTLADSPAWMPGEFLSDAAVY